MGPIAKGERHRVERAVMDGTARTCRSCAKCSAAMAAFQLGTDYDAMEWRYTLGRNRADQRRAAERAGSAIGGVKATAPARQFTDAEIEAWAERHDIAGNEAQLRVIFDDARSLVPAGVPVARETLANNSPCQPEGLMFDAFGNPRVRYVRVTFDGSHCILSVAELDAWKMEAEAAAASIGQTDPHTYSDVYLSEVEADALPEFDGF
jgi:hypothetical protein